MDVRSSRHCEIVTGALLLLVVGSGSASRADSSCGGSSQIFFNNITFTSSSPGTCLGIFYCDQPGVRAKPFYRLADPTCDPKSTDPTFAGCTVEAVVEYELPGNKNNSFPTLANIHWFDVSPAPSCNPRDLAINPNACPDLITACGVLGGPTITQDAVETFIVIPGVKCSNVNDPFQVYSTRAWACAGSLDCQKGTPIDDIKLGGPKMATDIGCAIPPPCKACACNVGGGAGPAGGGAGPPPPPGSGPQVLLRYKAGGVGHPGYPGSAEWNGTLGRYWSHEGAVRIVEAVPGSPETVWLLDENGTFTKFTDTNPTGVPNEYEEADPADEYRTLSQTATGWELRDLEGRVVTFDSAGRWSMTLDRNGNALTASYDGTGRLSGISKPDGTRETLEYYPVGDPSAGKLMTITLWGVLDADSKTWTYHWSGADMIRIDRPDGRSLLFEYDDPSNPNHPDGYMTRMRLWGDQGGSRLLQAWEYDEAGNVTAFWRGTEDKDDPNVVDRHDLSYDSPFQPTETVLTDPLGNQTTFVLEYVGRRFRRLEVNGTCPTCGFGPDTTFEYDDLANPLLPTAAINARGVRTEFVYDVNGRVTERREAVGTPLERTFTWEYDANFAAFPTVISQPSVDSGQLRTTAQVYDPGTGDLLSRTLDGFEGGLPLAGQETTFTYELSGQTSTIDPPGFGTGDATTFHYDDPNLNGQLPTRRSDPIVGDTHFEYEAFNRRIAEVDPNLLRTETAYDALDRVSGTRQCEVSQPSDTCDTPVGVVLETQSFYDEFGDLELTVLPAGNVIAYEYDAAGRLTAIERKADALPATHGERTSFTLDAAGNRVAEELQSWDGADWVTESRTQLRYATGCQVDKVTTGLAGEESVTEYAFDCNGNLEDVWDPNHPSAGQTNPPSTSYFYDELDRLTAVSQPWGGAAGGTTVTSYGYDVQDHLVTVTDAEGTVTAYEYSDRDLLTSESSEVSGLTQSTYNAHGELETSTDARGVLRTRTLDALDRVTQETYSGDPGLTVDYTYDDPSVDYSLGRLTRIARHGTGVDYEYDVFGRVTRDGSLTYGYDANGNRLTAGYPGGATATYGFDFADRHQTLEIQVGAGPPQSLVSSASYRPSGPLASLALGNGVTETRLFDSRYYPESIDVSGARSRTWTYTTDAVGSVTRIEDVLACASSDLVLSNQTVTTTEVFESCGDLTAGPGFQVAAPGDVTLRAVGKVGLESLFSVGSGAVLRLETGADLGLPVLTSRDYAYQDFQYFLTQADGPWGQRVWSYDMAGNRETEIRDGTTDTYVYEANTAGTGNRSRLDQVQLGVGGVRDYTFGPAGHQELVAAGANVIDFQVDDDGRLGGLDRLGATANFTYDGRSFLARGEEGGTGNFVESCYSSEGLLHSLHGSLDGGATTRRQHVIYFAGRPVAAVDVPSSGAETYTFLSTDHLGTPFVATDSAGEEVWAGGFEAFGRDWQAGTPAGAQDNGVFLRFPGQWFNETWQEPSLGAEIYYNVHRWYENGVGRYTRPDPLGLAVGELRSPGMPLADNERFSIYAYAGSSPLSFVDPLGLMKFAGCRQDQKQAIQQAFADYCKKIEQPGFESCMCDKSSIPKRLKGRCDDSSLTVRCKSKAEGLCAPTSDGRVTCAWSLPFTKKVRICPAAWQPTCGPMGCTLMHEMTHQLGHPREKWPKQVEKCLGCP